MGFLCRLIFKPSAKDGIGQAPFPSGVCVDDVEQQNWKSDAGLLDSRSGAGSVAVRTERGVRRQAVGLVIASTIVSIVCLLLVGATAVFLLLRAPWAADTTSQGEEEAVCLPCVQLCPTPPSDVTRRLVARLDVKMEDDDEMCCATTSQQFGVVVQLILMKQEEAQKIKNILDESPHSNITSSVSAHLILKSNVAKEDTADEVLRWKSPEESALSHVRPGLTLKDDVLYVLSAGVYYVYCQVVYDSNAATDRRVVSAYVYRDSLVSPHTSGIVFKTRHTWISEGTGRHNSYVGGVVPLHKGDKLYVRVSDRQLVSNDEKASFFGLFRVGQ